MIISHWLDMYHIDKLTELSRGYDLANLLEIRGISQNCDIC
jgi:hypothetical protein